MPTAAFTDADRDYIRANHATLEEVCAGRSETPDELQRWMAQGLVPGPSYVLEDGSAFVPRDFFRLIDEVRDTTALEAEFIRRYQEAGGSAEDASEVWRGYLTGIYGVCVRESLPEAICAKNLLVDECVAATDLALGSCALVRTLPTSDNRGQLLMRGGL